MKTALLSLLAALPLMTCGQAGHAGYLQRVLSGLQRIESASYRSLHEAYAPGDTIPLVFRRFYRELDNPADTTIGASYVSFDDADTTRFDFGYDGKVRVLPDHETKTITIDDFTARPLPFRPVNAPFFNKARNILQYALTTSDRIETHLEESDSEYHLRLVIDIRKTVEFFGKAFHMPDTGNSIWGPPRSVYEMWIRKEDDRPYRIRREQVHDISVETVSEVRINQQRAEDFRLERYFPADYAIRKYALRRQAESPSAIVGKKAPDWTLADAAGNAVSLGDFKGRILLINFTGIGCGPCYQAIPFLNSLKERYTDLDLAAIETWGKRGHSLRAYAERNNMSYPLLSDDGHTIEAYCSDRSVPVFILLDEHRIVRHVFRGFGKGTTDKEITEAIEKLRTQP